jgi:hypothetical protein
MKCRYCHVQAGWWRRRCPACRLLVRVYEENRGADFGTMIELFTATGVDMGQIERFLDAEIDAAGTVRDHIAASMMNDLMSALGSDVRQTAADVKRIRERGNWTNLDRRPTE